jgi:hypothetical protein
MAIWFMSLSKISHSNLDCDDVWDNLGGLGTLVWKLHAAISFKFNIIRKKVKIIFLKDIVLAYTVITRHQATLIISEFAHMWIKSKSKKIKNNKNKKMKITEKIKMINHFIILDR